jgi:hypothetical protein
VNVKSPSLLHPRSRWMLSTAATRRSGTRHTPWAEVAMGGKFIFVRPPPSCLLCVEMYEGNTEAHESDLTAHG